MCECVGIHTRLLGRSTENVRLSVVWVAIINQHSSIEGFSLAPNERIWPIKIAYRGDPNESVPRACKTPPIG